VARLGAGAPVTDSAATLRERRSATHSLARVARFVWVMAPPQIVFVYGLLWALAMEGSAALLSSTTGGWSPGRDTVIRVVTLIATAVFMRMLDEQKDLDYDRAHHPDRPLVTGAITARELRVSMALIAGGLVTLNALISAASVLLLLAVLAYGLGLFGLERISPAIRDGQIVNLFVTYPVQLLMSLYLYFSMASTGAITADWRVLALAGIFAGAFLHFEFARKTAWTASPGERLYSSVIGPWWSAACCIALALLAGACELAAFAPWSATRPVLALLPLVVLCLPLVGAQRFLTRSVNAWPDATAMLFVFGTYAALVAQAVPAL
jgi:hypothetical protein